MNRPHHSSPNLSAHNGRIVLELAVLAWMAFLGFAYLLRALILAAGGGV